MSQAANKENHLKGINLVTIRMKGHSGHSGYDRLADYMKAKQIAPPQKLSITDRLISRCFRELINRSGSIWYHRQHFLCEIKAAKQWMRSCNEIFHFIYGENSYQYLAKLKKIKPGNKIICTFHVPPEKFKVTVKDHRALLDIDGVIVVSSFQKDFFISLLGHQNVWFVPHGIDTDFFRPPATKPSENGKLNCIFIGNHLRDFKTLKKVIEQINHQNQNVFFHIISKPENLIQFKKYTNTQLHSNLSDHQLLDLYQKADLMTLPLIDSTANNSLLEGMACGLPIITTDLPATHDYLTNDCALFVSPGNAQGFVENILKLKHPEYRQKMGENSRRHSHDFDWRKITKTLIACYNQLI